MTRRPLVLAFVGLSLPLLAAAGACTTPDVAPGDDGGSPSPDASTDGGAPSGDDTGPGPSEDAGGDTGSPAPLAVAPTSGDVLTCATLQLTATGGTGAGAWSVTGAGSVSDAGDYAAPLVAPADAGVTVTYTAGTSSASAQLQVATAFLGTASLLPIDAGTNDTRNVPYEHQLTANGAHVYAGMMATTSSASDTLLETDVYASADDGKTFTGPTAYHTGDLSCATIAVDSGNASVVYLAYLAGHGDSTTNTGATLRLAVSTDGAQTFPVEYDLADSVNGLSSLICPDVASPSANHVIVAGVVADNNTAHVATWASSNQGANIGPASTEGIATTVNPDGGIYAPSDTNWGGTTGCFIYEDGSAGSPRIFSNSAGDACVLFQYSTGPSCVAPNNVAIQCTTDSGATWTSPLALGYPQADASFYPTGAISPNGTIAVTWLDTLPADAGSSIEAFVRISKDGGKTFGAALQYPSASTAAMGGSTLPVVAWENDSVLWLAQTGNVGNAASLYVDKTCDEGASWSGPVVVGGYQGTSMFLTSKGMVIAGDTTGSSSVNSVTTVTLAPQ